MSGISQETIISHEVIADIYSDDEPGPQAGKRWKSQHFSDRGHDIHTKDNVIKLSDLPVGARVLIQYPMCPKCGQTPEDLLSKDNKVIDHDHYCRCGEFDWTEWAVGEFC